MTSWINGEAGGELPADDRGLLYGDGVFETIAFHHRRAALWALHMERLARSCRVLELPMPEAAELLDACLAALDGADRAVVRITLTRGSGGRAYRPPESPQPRVVVSSRPLPVELEAARRDGITMISAPFPLVAVAPLAGLKHLNRLPQVLLARACQRAGADEVLACDPEGDLVEALSGNLVIERNGQLWAPGPHPAAVAGVGLEWLRRQAGSALKEAPMARSALRASDSIWVLNSVQGFRPVLRLDDEARPPGRTLRHWQRRWTRSVES